MLRPIERREERIFVLRTEDGLVVKRAGKGTGGRWQLISDHPRWPDAPWPGDATIIGEVKMDGEGAMRRLPFLDLTPRRPPGCDTMNTYIQKTLEDRRYGDFDSTGS